MGERGAKFGLTLPNRGVITGATTMEEMLALARMADAETIWDSVWVGDSILAKPRLDAIALLGALAVGTERVKLGPACFASTPLRNALLLAYQWASLDYMSGGRTIFVACQGQPAAGRGGNFAEEFAAFGIDPSSRMRRMEEAVDIMRLLTSEESASYEGEYNRFENVTVLPRPVQQPVPIWLVANPDPAKKRNVETALRRVVRYGDGWQTTWNTPESFAQHLSTIKGYAEEEDRDLGEDFEACLYYNINVGGGARGRTRRGQEVPRRLLLHRLRSRAPQEMGRLRLAQEVRRAAPGFHRGRSYDRSPFGWPPTNQKVQFERVTREYCLPYKAAFCREI